MIGPDNANNFDRSVEDRASDNEPIDLRDSGDWADTAALESEPFND